MTEAMRQENARPRCCDTYFNTVPYPGMPKQSVQFPQKGNSTPDTGVMYMCLRVIIPYAADTFNRIRLFISINIQYISV